MRGRRAYQAGTALRSAALCAPRRQSTITGSDIITALCLQSRVAAESAENGSMRRDALSYPVTPLAILIQENSSADSSHQIRVSTYRLNPERKGRQPRSIRAALRGGLAHAGLRGRICAWQGDARQREDSAAVIASCRCHASINGSSQPPLQRKNMCVPWQTFGRHSTSEAVEDRAMVSYNRSVKRGPVVSKRHNFRS